MPIRLDMPMSETKARIFDAVERAGQHGIPRDDLWRLYCGWRAQQHRRLHDGQRHVLKVQISQINALLVGCGYRIHCGCNGATYRLRKRETFFAENTMSAV